MKPTTDDDSYGLADVLPISDSESHYWVGFDLNSTEEDFSAAPASFEASADFTFDEKGRQTSYTMGGYSDTDGESYIFVFHGPIQSWSATFTPSGSSAAKPAATTITPVPSDKGNSMYRMYIPTAGSTSTRQTWPKGTSCSQPAGSMKASPGQLRRLRRHRFTASTIPTAATTTTQRTRPRRAC